MMRSTYARRSFGRALLVLLAIVISSVTGATTTTKATYDGTNTVIEITWTSGGDGAQPAEFRNCLNQGGAAANSLKYFFNGSNQYIDSKPQQMLTTIRPWYPRPCDGNAFFAGVVQVYGNPFRVTIPNRNVMGQKLCYGGRNDFGDVGKFVNGTCTTLESEKPPVICTVASATVAHGDLAVPAVAGNVESVAVRVTCTGGAAVVRVRAVRSASNPTATVPLRGDSSVTSHLTVNGSDGASGALVSVGANQAVDVTLTSTLSANAPAAGNLLGNAIVIVDVQ